MLKTFPIGGIHPAENKFSAGQKIERLDLPTQVAIPISQHIGAPSEPVVNKGDIVKTGQLIAKSTGFISANIHSSVSGKVAKIDKVPDSTGYKQTCIVIDVDGDEWMENIDRSDDIVKEITAEPDEIRNKVNEAGVVGLGGACFPSHVKLSVPPGKTAKYVVINAVECEPCLTADHQLMLEKGEEIIIGCKIMQKALNAEKIHIGIENNKPDAIDYFRKITADYSDIEVHPLKVQYPQGGEKQLIKAILNREVPSGGLPIDVDCVVHNVGTAYAVYEAVQKNKPLFERVVTVTGKNVKHPKNIMARIGTQTDILIEAAGGIPENTGKIINGGPMMGKALPIPNVPVTKGTSGLVLFDETDSFRPEVYNCIRCGRCVTVCAMALEPYLLKNMCESSLYEELQAEKLYDCIECGSCSYICPSGVPLLDYIRLGKSKLNAILRSKKS